MTWHASLNLAESVFNKSKYRNKLKFNNRKFNTVNEWKDDLDWKRSKLIIRWWDCKIHHWAQREMKTPGFAGIFWTFSAVDSQVWLDFFRIPATMLICKPSLWCSGNQVLDDRFFSQDFQAESLQVQSCFGINLAYRLVGRFPSARMIGSCLK
jgi:hypothetical protein